MNTINWPRLKTSCAIAALCWGLHVTEASAQTNPGSSSSITPGEVGDAEAGTDIIVTAQKREQLLKDVPMSIVALSASELRERNVTRIDDLGTVVPGLSVQQSGGPYRSIVLRGISNATGNASLIGVYLDEASVT